MHSVTRKQQAGTSEQTENEKLAIELDSHETTRKTTQWPFGYIAMRKCHLMQSLVLTSCYVRLRGTVVKCRIVYMQGRSSAQHCPSVSVCVCQQKRTHVCVSLPAVVAIPAMYEGGAGHVLWLLKREIREALRAGQSWTEDKMGYFSSLQHADSQPSTNT